jgi:hypothetical protein
MVYLHNERPPRIDERQLRGGIDRAYRCVFTICEETLQLGLIPLEPGATYQTPSNVRRLSAPHVSLNYRTGDNTAYQGYTSCTADDPSRA